MDNDSKLIFEAYSNSNKKLLKEYWGSHHRPTGNELKQKANLENDINTMIEKIRQTGDPRLMALMDVFYTFDTLWSYIGDDSVEIDFTEQEAGDSFDRVFYNANIKATIKGDDINVVVTAEGEKNIPQDPQESGEPVHSDGAEADFAVNMNVDVNKWLEGNDEALIGDVDELYSSVVNDLS